MKKILLLACMAVLTAAVSAQDRHFSQFYASPLTLNPALSGAFDGKYRVGTSYRDQWRGTLDQPFQTFTVGGDLRMDLPFARRTTRDKVGLGLLFFRDKINSLDFSTTQIALSGAFHKSLNYNNSQYLSVGFQGGLTQRNINYENLTFQDQWNGIDGYTLPPREALPANNFGYPDVSVGLNYAITPASRTAFFAGIAAHHVNRPNVAFYRGDGVPVNRLNMRLSAQLAAQLPLTQSGSLMFSPRLLAALQGPHLEVNGGGNFRIMIDQTYGTSLHLGGWVRPVRNQDGFTIDALVFNAGLEYNNIVLGLSYDASLPTLRRYNRTAGVFEITLIYLGEFQNDELLCPTF